MLLDIGLGNDFFRDDTTIQATKAKINKWLYQTKNFCTAVSKINSIVWNGTKNYTPSIWREVDIQNNKIVCEYTTHQKTKSDLKNGQRSKALIVSQWKRIQLGTMRLRVQSLASFSGLRIWDCHELWCSLQMQLRSCIAVAVAQAISCSSDLTSSLGTSMCCKWGPKKQKKKKKAKQTCMFPKTGKWRSTWRDRRSTSLYYQRNANQNHNEVSLHTCLNAIIKKRHQVLAKMWRKRSPCALFVGM